jgi:ABC-type multidrug transport system fused ATPase/permease subunit
LFGRASTVIEHIATLSRKQADANLASTRLRAALQPLYIVLMSAGVVLLVWQGGERVLAGAMTVGGFVAYLELYLRAVNRGLREVPVLINQIQASAAAYARIQALCAPPLTMRGEPPFASFRPNHIVGMNSPANNANARVYSTGAVPVSIQNITFRYPGATEPALKNVSLEIPAGALVAVTGPVGSGKSALARALLGLYPLESGRVLFDGHAPAVGYLPQEPFLFSGSVRENILFGVNHTNGIERTIDLAALGDDLRSFPAGIETPIGELGIRVSGGQRQRIALSRALAAFAPHAPGLLVLDDPFSSLDVDTESRIVAGLREAFGPLAARERRATILLCSHRLAAFPHADMVVVLDKGRIVECGTHAELFRAGKLYARIYDAQRRMEQPE